MRFGDVKAITSDKIKCRRCITDLKRGSDGRYEFEVKQWYCVSCAAQLAGETKANDVERIVEAINGLREAFTGGHQSNIDENEIDSKLDKIDIITGLLVDAPDKINDVMDRVGALEYEMKQTLAQLNILAKRQSQHGEVLNNAVQRVTDLGG